MPKPQQLDTEMAQLRVQRLHFEDLLNKQPQIRQIRQADGQPLTSEQSRILEAQLRTQRELLNSLLQGGDTLILELTKLCVQQPAGRCVERGERGDAPLSLLDVRRASDDLLVAN